MRNINEFPIQVKMPVAWGEMDAYNHVNNVWYFRYFENSRAKYFDEIGIREVQAETGIGPVLAETKCNFLQPLRYPDRLVVGSRVRSVGQTSFVMEYMIVSDKLGVAATGEGVIVMFDFNATQKVSIPSEIKTGILRLEKERFLAK